MRTLVIQVAALGWDVLEKYRPLFAETGLRFFPASSCFPALTCPAQAVFRTASSVTETGVWGNGRFDPIDRKTVFWGQSSAWARGARIWDDLRARGGKVGMLFWQQSLGETVDVLLSPAPIHKHHGGMIQDCCCRPEFLYRDLVHHIGGGFPLHRYWGPLASLKSSAWIARATAWIMSQPELAPDLLLTYIPHLDYALQRHGPGDAARTERAVRELLSVLSPLCRAAGTHGYRILLWGDYAMVDVSRPVPLNRLLRDAGLFQVRTVHGMTYPDLHHSRAFAMVDHQTALILCPDRDLLEKAITAIRVPGVDAIEPLSDAGGVFAPWTAAVVTAAADAWFCYPWWERDTEAPDFARHVDIHSKIGYDPCELFFGWPPPGVSLNPARIRGSHGRTDRAVAWGADWDIAGEVADLTDLSRALARGL